MCDGKRVWKVKVMSKSYRYTLYECLLHIPLQTCKVFKECLIKNVEKVKKREKDRYFSRWLMFL